MNTAMHGTAVHTLTFIPNPSTMLPRYALFLASFIALPWLLQAQPLVTGSFTFGGILREYRLYVPASYSHGTPAPLVFNLHGYGSNNQQQEFYGDFRPIADTAGFIIAHPQGTTDGNGSRFWNTFGSSNVDDLGFITALLDTISARYTIDADRVYSTGMSNGGFMSHDLACFRSSRFAAIASVTGTMITQRMNSCAAVHPTPVMQIHGTADGTVPYTGGSGFVPVETLVERWRQFNNCNPTPTVTQVPDIAPNDGCTVEHYVYGGGNSGSTVELFKVLGGGHTWPGAAFNTGVTNQDIKASTEIWRFFLRYRLSELATGIADRNEPVFSVGPNPSADVFNLRFGNVASRTITVHNASGQLVLETRSADAEVVLEPAGNGLFLITVECEGRRSSMRVVKL
jgi:polyhydroxybutyrate depolymerase